MGVEGTQIVADTAADTAVADRTEVGLGFDVGAEIAVGVAGHNTAAGSQRVAGHNTAAGSQRVAGHNTAAGSQWVAGCTSNFFICAFWIASSHKFPKNHLQQYQPQSWLGQCREQRGRTR